MSRRGAPSETLTPTILIEEKLRVTQPGRANSSLIAATFIRFAIFARKESIACFGAAAAGKNASPAGSDRSARFDREI